MTVPPDYMVYGPTEEQMGSSAIKMTRQEIALRLRIYVANVALAAVGKKDGDLREAVDALFGEVERIISDAADMPSELQEQAELLEKPTR